MLDMPAKRPLTKADQQRALATMMKFYGDRAWRLDHLYYVQDETGTKVLYQRREAQKAYSEDSWVLDILAKARQLGFSTHIAIEICDFCVFNKDKACGIIDFKLEDAEKKLAKIKFAYENLPEWLKQRNPLVKSNESELRWANGSRCEVGTSHRGGTLQFLHISEFGKIAAEKPEVAQQIVTGALNTIAPGQIIKVESTAHGTSGRFYEMVERAKAKLASGTPLSVLDFKLHFYGWMYNPAYRIPSGLVLLTNEVQSYFLDPKDGLKAKYGITVDGDQMAWYQQKLTLLGWDDMKEEFPSHLDECFYNSMEGAFFKKEMARARADKRIGFQVPFDPTRRVHTCWDKGMNEKSDRNAIWWFQHDGVRFRWVDYYENAGEGIPHYAAVVEEKRIARKFVYGIHYGPHDLNQRVWANTSPTPKTMKDIAKDVGIDFKIVDRVEDKEISIEAARRCINNSWFDEEHCKRGIECLDNYRKTWNKIISDWTMVPFHNWASNCFVGETEILTRDGLKRISDLPYSGEVLTLCGWKAYRNPRITLKNAQLVEVTFSDGLSVKCTPDHLFLTVSGWKSAASLARGFKIQSSLMPSTNISMAKFTASHPKMGIIDTASCFIERSGRVLSELSQRVATSIIKILCAGTMISRTLNVCRHQSTANFLGNPEWLSMVHRLSILPHASALPSGIGQMPADFGTDTMPKEPSPIKNGSVSQKRANVAERFSNASFEANAEAIHKNGARSSAVALHIISVKKMKQCADVWDLTVPGVQHFSLANGAIVHNSADALMCGAMGITPDKPEREGRREKFGNRKGTHWSA